MGAMELIEVTLVQSVHALQAVPGKLVGMVMSATYWWEGIGLGRSSTVQAAGAAWCYRLWQVPGCAQPGPPGLPHMRGVYGWVHKYSTSRTVHRRIQQIGGSVAP